MSAAITNMALMFGGMQVAKKIPFEENPDLITYARIAYISAQLLCLGVFYYCSIRVKRTNDLTVLKYVEPKSPMSQEPGELVTTTNKDYDLAEISKAMRGVFMGMLFVGVMHLYMGYTQPLVLQSVMPIKNALESKQAQLWVFGKAATGDLKRPFKAAPGLFGMQGGGGPQTDKAAIKEAEKAGGVAVAKKDE